MLATCLILAASFVDAAVARPFNVSVAQGMAADPFYASRLLGHMDTHLQALWSMPPADAARFLKSELGSLSAESLDPRQVSAALVAAAVVSPASFESAAVGLETLRPGLGFKVAETVRERAPRSVLDKLHGLEFRLFGETADGYDRFGRLYRFFDR